MLLAELKKNHYKIKESYIAEKKMITLNKNVDFTRLRPAFEALKRKESLVNARTLILPAKEKEEDEETEETEEIEKDVNQLFLEIHANYDNETKARQLIDELNQKLPDQSIVNQKLFELLGIYENGQFIYGNKAIVAYDDEFSFNLPKKGYELGPKLLDNKNLNQAKYVILIHMLSIVPQEGNDFDPVREVIEKLVAPVYAQLKFDETTQVPGALQTFRILDSDDSFLTPESNDELAGFVTRYYQVSRYLMARLFGETEKAEQIMRESKLQQFKDLTTRDFDLTALNALAPFDFIGDDFKWGMSNVFSVFDGEQFIEPNEFPSLQYKFVRFAAEYQIMYRKVATEAIIPYMILEELGEPVSIRRINFLIDRFATLENGLQEIIPINPFEKFDESTQSELFKTKFKQIGRYLNIRAVEPAKANDELQDMLGKLKSTPYYASETEYLLLLSFKKLVDKFAQEKQHNKTELVSNTQGIFKFIRNDLSLNLSRQQSNYLKSIMDTMRYTKTELMRFLDYNQDAFNIQTVQNWRDFVDSKDLSESVYYIPKDVLVWVQYEMARLSTFLSFTLMLVTYGTNLIEIEEFKNVITKLMDSDAQSNVLLYQFDKGWIQDFQSKKPKTYFQQFKGFLQNTPSWFTRPKEEIIPYEPFIITDSIKLNDLRRLRTTLGDVFMYRPFTKQNYDILFTNNTDWNLFVQQDIHKFYDRASDTQKEVLETAGEYVLMYNPVTKAWVNTLSVMIEPITEKKRKQIETSKQRLWLLRGFRKPFDEEYFITFARSLSVFINIVLLTCSELSKSVLLGGRLIDTKEIRENLNLLKKLDENAKPGGSLNFDKNMFKDHGVFVYTESLGEIERKPVALGAKMDLSNPDSFMDEESPDEIDYDTKVNLILVQPTLEKYLEIVKTRPELEQQYISRSALVNIGAMYMDESTQLPVLNQGLTDNFNQSKYGPYFYVGELDALNVGIPTLYPKEVQLRLIERWKSFSMLLDCILSNPSDKLCRTYAAEMEVDWRS